MKDKLAVFDIKGTLFDWNLEIKFAIVLARKEVFSKEVEDGIIG